ncbi:MAG: FAD:protein FMN transferase [Planctomycetota bacterium]
MSARAALLLLGLALAAPAPGQDAPPAPAPKQPPPPAPKESPAPARLEERSFEGGVMGTSLQITVLGPDVEVLERALREAVAELRRVEDEFTTWRPSPLTRLNDRAGQGPQRCSHEAVVLIGRSLEVSELTHGAFDVTFYSVGKLWDFKAKPPKLPSKEEVAAALRAVGYQKVKVDPERDTIELPAGTKIGLGGIAKGYGVDRAMALIMKLGIRHAVVNAGGDLKALGKKHGQPWEIAIKHPRERDKVLAVLPVSNVCVVTSGDYERFFEHEGKRYHHILDPRTGYPSEGCMSATVTAPDAAFADALATAMCVLGPVEGLKVIDALPRVEAILVGLDGKVHFSKGLRRAAPPGN